MSYVAVGRSPVDVARALAKADTNTSRVTVRAHGKRTPVKDRSGYVWIAPKEGRAGYWARKGKGRAGVTVTVTAPTPGDKRFPQIPPSGPIDYAGANVTDHRTAALLAKCQETGMPAVLLGPCVAMAKEGIPMEAIVAELQKQVAEQAAAPAAAATGAVPKKRNWLAIGGVAGAGLLALLLLRRGRATP